MKFTYASGSRPLDGYTVKRGIGAGGFGEVYFATSDGGKEVALKHIQRNLEVEIRGVSQCLNLKHPNLVALYDIRYDSDGEAWVVMEYVSGESLLDLLDKHPQGLPIKEMRRWMQGIVAGVSYLHDQGIVHRDLKPGNLFLDEETVKIGDYGLSKFISCSRHSGHTETVGTFHYMAPEIGLGRYGKEIDIYALGIVLYEMMTGRVPFDGESSQEIIMKHLTADPDLSDIAEPYRGVIAQALAKDPELRGSSVCQLVAPLGLELGEGFASLGPQGVAPEQATATPASPGASIPAAGEPSLAKQGVFTPVGMQPNNPGSPRFQVDESITVAELVAPRADESPHDQTPNGVGPGVQGPGAHRSDGVVARPDRSAKSDNLLAWFLSTAGIGTTVAMLVALFVFATQVMMGRSEVALIGLGFFALLIASLVYRNIKETNRKPFDSDEYPPGESRPPSPERRHSRRNWHSQRNTAKDCLREHLACQAPREQLTELVESFLRAAMVVGSLGVVVISLFPRLYAPSPQGWFTSYAYLTVVTLVAVWLFLMVSKYWEACGDDQAPRRYPQLAIGLVVGTIAWGLCQWLHVDLVRSNWLPTHGLIHQNVGDEAWHAMGQLPVFVLYFGSLFFLPRWWRQADPLRDTFGQAAPRFKLWTTLGCLLWSWVISSILLFPQPWGLMFAGSISITLQLASPWMSPRKRTEIYRQMVEGR